MNIKRVLTKEELGHGKYYEGHSRSGSIARWDGHRQEFRQLRRKFGFVFAGSIKHIADETYYDAFSPVKETDPPPGVEIKFYIAGE